MFNEAQRAAGALPRIRARGRKLAPHEDLYHWVLKLSWPWFFLVMTLLFLVTNGVFATLYTLHPGCIHGAASWFDHFFFSVQTLGTIGYGAMVPQNNYGHLLVSVEALLGLIGTAVVTGLTFSRFARPSARILFTRNVILGARDGQPYLMVRCANWRQNQIIEAGAHLTLLRVHRTREGDVSRVLTDLPLVRQRTPTFAMSWTLFHPVNSQSPFYGEDALVRLADEGAELFVSISGLDETLAQPLHARKRYRIEDIISHARFADILDIHEDGTHVIDFDRFHDIIKM